MNVSKRKAIVRGWKWLLCGLFVLGINGFGLAFTDSPIFAGKAFAYSGTPHNGPHSVPGTVQAEDFDEGGEGTAYHSPVAAASPPYRATDSVNLVSHPGGGYDIGIFDAANGQDRQNLYWYVYTVEVEDAGYYQVGLRYAANIGYADNTQAGFTVDGLNMIKEYSLASTGGTGVFDTVTLARFVYLDEGTHNLTFNFNSQVDLRVDSFTMQADTAPPDPAIVTPGLPADDIVVREVSVADFGASVTATDNTEAFQEALDQVAQSGGGTVWVPDGAYNIGGELVIRNNVTLRGSWRSPDDGTAAGTVLKTTANSGNEIGTPFIRLAGSSTAISNLSIWYPDQSAASPSAYPWTLYLMSGDYQTVENVTMYNSYKGIGIGQGAGTNSNHELRNVYCTCLSQGVKLDKVVDIGRIENLHIDNATWTGSGLAGAPSPGNTTLRDYTRSNLVGVEYQRSDEEQDYGLFISDARIGLRMTASPLGTMFGMLTNLELEHVNRGIQTDQTNYHGTRIVGGTITADIGTDPVGILVNSPWDQLGNILYVDGVTMNGAASSQVRVTSDSPISLHGMNFADWDTQAVDMEQGALTLTESVFGKSGLGIKLETAVKAASILSNTFTGTPQIVNDSAGMVEIDHTERDMPTAPAVNYSFAPEKRPASASALYNVMKVPYSAAGDGKADDTAAIQSALDDAFAAGGGTVYLPRGWYRIDTSLSVPEGVELRGVINVRHIVAGSTLLAYGGRGDEDGMPLISLAGGGGLRGISVYYPEQSVATVTSAVEYPWTVQGTGDGLWIQDVALGLSWNGIDLATYHSDNHVLSGIAATPLHTGISIGHGAENGQLENTNLTWVPGYAMYDNHRFSVEATFDIEKANLTGFEYGGVSGEQSFGNFVLTPNIGYSFHTDSAGSPDDSVFIMSGVDSSQQTGYDFAQSGGSLTFVSPWVIGSLETEASYGGTVVFHNLGISSEFQGAHAFDAGDVTIAQGGSSPSMFMAVTGGTFRSYNMISSGMAGYSLGSGVDEAEIMAGMGRSGIAILNNAGTNLTTAGNVALSTGNCGNGAGTCLVTGQTLSGPRSDADGQFGLQFTTGPDPIEATWLGRQYLSGNSGDHTLYLYRASDHALLGSTTVHMTVGQPDDRGYKYAPLAAPVALEPDTAYVITSGEAIGGDQWYDDSTTIDSLGGDAVMDGSVSIGSGGTWSALNGGDFAYGPVNLLYDPIVPVDCGNGSGTCLFTGQNLGSLRSDITGQVGFQFTTGPNSLTASWLGREFAPGNEDVHTLYLYRESDHALLGSATVDMDAGTPDDLGYIYGELASPVTLEANTAYVLLSGETLGGDQWYDDNTSISHLNGDAVINRSRFMISGSWSTHNSGSYAYGPLNLLYDSE